MSEKIIQIESVDPRDIYGVNDKNIDLIKKLSPKLKIVARGDVIRINGSVDDIQYFMEKLDLMIRHIHRYGKLTEEYIIKVLENGNHKDNENNHHEESSDSSVIVHGRNGALIKARTPNQQLLVDNYKKNDLLFAIGPAGTGKTYTAVALAVRALKNKEVKRIILTRPAVEAGENLGFLPGDMKDKLDPYLQPLYDALNDMLPPTRLQSYIEDGTIQIAPLAFMRGRTLSNAFAILDEAQNATELQMKMFLTRMGENSKFIVTGDVTQVDLPRHQSSGLIHSIKILKNVESIGFIYLDQRDIVRHKLVVRIVEAYGKADERAKEAKAAKHIENKLNQ